MCLILDYKESVAKIAERDIEVYKTDGKSFFFGLLFRPGIMEKFIYLKYKKTKRVNIKPIYYENEDYVSIENRYWEINEGYHAYKNEDDLSDYYTNKNKGIFYRFIIPKGTIYFDNDYEICAERLIYKGKTKKQIRSCV